MFSGIKHFFVCFGIKINYICTPLKKRVFKKGLVVQLVRMPACHAGGREFESRPDRKATHIEWLFLCSKLI